MKLYSNEEVILLLVALIGKNKIFKILLPQIAVGNYWLTDGTEKERKLINIEGIKGKWYVTSNSSVKIIAKEAIKTIGDNFRVDYTKILDRATLCEYDRYIVQFGNSEELFTLCCFPVCDKNLFHLYLKNKNEITIGSSKNNDIVYNNEFVSDVHAKLYFDNGSFVLKNYDMNFGTFVNNKPVPNDGVVLTNGDVVFIMGLKIIIMGKGIFINTPENKIICNNEAFSLVKRNIEIDKNNENEEDIELYSKDDYFSRAPRITNIIEREKVKIDAPPHIQNQQEMPLILVLGSSLSMGTMMLISIITAIDGRVSGTATTKQTVFSLITAIAMLISMIVFPMLSVKYDRKRKKKYEEKRQRKYKDYLASKNEYINNIMNKQRSILFKNYVSAEECAQIILEKNSRLWERKIEDYDFLSVRFGIGDIPLEIDIQYPEEKFEMEDDNLLEILNNIASNSKTLKSAPIVTSLTDKNISAIITNEETDMDSFIQNIIIQLITFHSYEDLKLVFLLKDDKQKKWDYVKMLPHVWNNTKQIRFFADNYDDMKEISAYLEEDLNNRLQYKDKDYKSFTPYYLIITDDYKKIENLKIVTEILKTKTNVGFSLLCITNDLMQLPNQCKTFISLDNNKYGVIFQNKISSTNQQTITFDNSVKFFFNKLSNIISNIPIRYNVSGNNLLPNSYTFLEMYDVGLIEQLNVLERWYKNDPTLSLRAPIGIDSSEMPIVLDIHEKFHGPHGLIAGSTGSGKSEFIITYILSLAVNYHPDDVTFILIDYKGGGLAGAFQKRDIKLPHLVGTITNIDTIGLQRSLASIHSELRRRQILFNEARNMTDEGTIDIYKYQKLYHEGVLKTPIPHLLIICDEFAELKQQQEDFMDELMSVSRIGRSLGVHLILATQKPAGIVNDQIRSNSKFAICLKVQDKEDSTDVIKKPDAAFLKKAGQFYMQVGHNEYFILGQSAWSGAPYFPSDITEKKVDNSLQFISNTGVIIKQVDDNNQKYVSNQGEQLTNIVRYLSNIAKQNNIKVDNLWLDNIDENIFLADIKKKYNIRKEKNIIQAVIGEFDDPYNQRQGIVNINLSNHGNTVIYGNAESGKETLLSTMIYDLITTYSSDEVQLYILDFGTEALKIYNNSNHVGDTVFINNTEKVGRFFDMLQREIKYRKEELSEYNGDYNLYLKTSSKKMPLIVVTLNNYEAFAEVYENKYDDLFITLTREGLKCGIVFIVTVSNYNNMKYRLSQNFKERIALQLNNKDDYLNIFEKVGKKRPSNIFGRGLVSIDKDLICEFQTAKICAAEEYNTFIKETIEDLNIKNPTIANSIPTIPDQILLSDVREYLKDLSNIPIGITKTDLRLYNYNFKKELINIITGRNIEDAAQFTSYVLQQMLELQNVDINIFDAEKIISSKKTNIKVEYNEFISNLDKNKAKDIVCVIIGVDKFINDYNDVNNNFNLTFNSTIKKAEELGNCNFIFVESVQKIKNHEYDEWFKNFVTKDNGIWVGNGFDSQYLLTISSERRLIVGNCGDSFGYALNRGIATLIKLIEMRENGEVNE